jgi:PAS domain S-box-containing protein
VEAILRVHRTEAELQRVTGELRSVTRTLHQMMEHSLDVICSMNARGEFTEVSAAAEKVLGYRRGELLGRTALDLVHPEDRARTVAERAHILAGRETRDFENRYVRKDGSIAHIMWSASWSPSEQTMFCVARDVTERKRSEAFIVGQRGVLELIARSAPLGQTLEAITRLVEAQEPGLVCSILELDESGRLLRTAAAPHLPTAYNQAIDGLQIGPEVGSCGAAAFRRETVIAGDIATHPFWAAFRDLALSHGLRACWSAPVTTSDGHVLGTFALYARVPSEPNDRQLDSMAAAAQLAGIAFERSRAAQQLERNRQRYRSLFDQHPDAVFSVDLEGRFLEVNAGMERLSCYTAEQLQHATFRQLVVPEHAHLAEAQFATTVAGEAATSKLLTIRGDGCLRVASITSLPILVDGRIVGVFGVARDITEHHEHEERLRESEVRFRQIAENVEDAFWIIDVATQRIIYLNPACERLRGTPGEPIDRDPIAHLASVHPQDRERVRRAGDRDPSRFNEEYRVVQPDGSIRWHWTRLFPIHDSDGQLYRLGGIARDITARKEAEELIREQAALLDCAQEAIFVQNLTGTILYWNKSAERIYGCGADEAIGQLFTPHAIGASEAHDAARALVIEKGVWVGELNERTPDGREIIVEAHWTVVRDADDIPKSILCINTDITERKRLETQFLRAQRMESIGTLAGGIAHDLNNVLSPIMMSIDLLKIHHPEPATLEILDTIETSARHGADMVKQVLSFARGVEGQRLLVQPKYLLKDIQKISTDAFPKNIQLKIASTADLWNILGDPTQLHQVLLNLCVNARDAMPHGGSISISAENVYLDKNYAAMNIEAQPGPHIVLNVQDTGTGMTPDIIEKIFDPFFTTKELGKGTGLGLSSSLAIVKSHGGFIRVNSEPGKGTTFKVYLPAQTNPHDTVAENAAPLLPRGRGQTILIVDDEASIRTITQQTLEAFGYRTLLACDGAEAVATYAQHQAEIAVVLTDMMMPVMDGPATIQVLARINPQVRIIAASGLTANGQLIRSGTTAARYFLPKPYTAESLLRTLAALLSAEA